MATGCGNVDRAVVSDTKRPVFDEQCHLQLLLSICVGVHCRYSAWKDEIYKNGAVNNLIEIKLSLIFGQRWSVVEVFTPKIATCCLYPTTFLVVVVLMDRVKLEFLNKTKHFNYKESCLADRAITKQHDG